MAGNVFNFGVSFVVNVMIARLMKVVDFGILNFSLSLSGLLAYLSDIGLNSLMIRNASGNRSKISLYVRSIVALKFFIGLSFIVLVSAVVHLKNFKGEDAIVVYMVALATLLLSNLAGTFLSVFVVLERFEVPALVVVIDSLLYLMGVGFVYHYRGGITWIAFAFLAKALATFIMILFFLWKLYRIPRPRISLGFSLGLVRRSIFFSMATIFTTVYTTADIILLSFLKGEEAVAYYSAASKIFVAVTAILSSMTNPLFPVMSRVAKNSREELGRLAGRSMKHMLSVCVPLAMFLMVFSQKIIVLIYSSKYEQSAPVLLVLSLCLLLLPFNWPIGLFLQSSGQEKNVALIAGLCAALNIACNLVFIKTYGFYGAAISMVATYIGFLLFSFVFAHKHLFRITWGLHPVRQTATFLLLGVSLYVLKDENIVLAMLGSGAVYAASVLLLGVFDREDLRILGLSRNHEIFQAH